MRACTPGMHANLHEAHTGACISPATTTASLPQASGQALAVVQQHKSLMPSLHVLIVPVLCMPLAEKAEAEAAKPAKTGCGCIIC